MPWAIVKRSSTVTILPFTKMVSAGSAAKIGEEMAHSHNPAATTEEILAGFDAIPVPARSQFIVVPPCRSGGSNDNPLHPVFNESLEGRPREWRARRARVSQASRCA